MFFNPPAKYSTHPSLVLIKKNRSSCKGIDSPWLTPLARSATTAKDAWTPSLGTVPVRSQDVPDNMQRVTGFHHGFCYMPNGFTSLPNKGYGSVNCVNTSTAHAFENAIRNRMLTAAAGGSQRVDIVHLPVQGVQVNVEKWCGGRMQQANEKPMVSPEVVSALMAREQLFRPLGHFDIFPSWV